MPRCNIRSVARNHDLVRVRDIEVVAQQFADKVGIGIFGIEQFDPVGDAVALGSQIGKLGLAMLQLLARIRPCADAGRPDQCKRRKSDDPGSRRDLSQPAPPRPGRRGHTAPSANQALVAFGCIVAWILSIAHELQENHTKPPESSGFRRFCRQSAIKCGEQGAGGRNAMLLTARIGVC